MIVSINLHLPYKSEKLETRTRDNKPAAAVQTAAIISLTSLPSMELYSESDAYPLYK
jgi:hypothetical protein